MSMPHDYNELIPAGGKDYKTAKEARAAFEAGEDWVYCGPTQTCYCSIRDFAVDQVANLRYRNKTMIAVFPVTAAALARSQGEVPDMRTEKERKWNL